MKFMQKLTGEKNKLLNIVIFGALLFIATMLFAFFRNEWIKIAPSMAEIYTEIDNISTMSLLFLLIIFFAIYKILKRILKKLIKKH